MPTTFRRLLVRDWRQFREVDVGFDPRLTVLTGANGAGKTALLRILARHFQAVPGELSVLSIDPDSGAFYFATPRRRPGPSGRD